MVSKRTLASLVLAGALVIGGSATGRWVAKDIMNSEMNLKIEKTTEEISDPSAPERFAPIFLSDWDVKSRVEDNAVKIRKEYANPNKVASYRNQGIGIGALIGILTYGGIKLILKPRSYYYNNNNNNNNDYDYDDGTNWSRTSGEQRFT